MNIYNYRIHLCMLLLGVLLLGNTELSYAAAGKVVFATGQPIATNTAGAQRTLKRGSEVESGDVLTTNASSRIQIAMSDGAYISVQPNTEYVLQQYNYSGKPDGSEQAIYRLTKGGIRAVTGLIGKQNPDAYKVHTPVATIGIRGTGHNTFYCVSNCGSRGRGLFHNTWEGETFVVNDVDSVDVPAGEGVYVEDIDEPIVKLDQPPGETALQTTKEKQQEQQQEEEQGQVFVAGDQRNEEGNQIVVDDEEGNNLVVVEEEEPVLITVTSSTATDNQVLQFIAPDLEDIESVDAGLLTDSIIFRDDDGKLVGILGTEDDDGVIEDVLAILDIGAVLGVDDPALAAFVQTFIDSVDEDTLNTFISDPAEAVEDFSIGNINFARISEGYLLAIDEGDVGGTGEIELDDLTEGFTSIHTVFGETPGPLPTSGFASYSFVGGTDSTSVSGATIGNGATNGFISVDFLSLTASINLDVDHNGNLYSISGGLNIDGHTLTDNAVLASTSAAGSACNPVCPTFIDGTFIGPEVMGIMPENIGIEYDIQDTDVITGVAGFTYP